MKRIYAAARLLEHGPLEIGEFKRITGWRGRSAEVALRDLQFCGTVVHRRVGRRHVYALANPVRRPA